RPRRGRRLAWLPVAHGAGRRRRLVAHLLHAAHATGRVRAARARVSQAHAERDRPALLDRAGADLGQHLPRADAGRAPEDDGCGQTLGAAAFVRAGDPPRRPGSDPLLAAQPLRRQAPRHRGRGRARRLALHAVQRAAALVEAVGIGRASQPGCIMSTAQPILALRKATKKYAGVPAIEDVDFELLPGEVHAIVGENGAGKSTLTKVMAGVVNLTSGEMLIEGRSVNARTPTEARELGVAMVFQETSLV